MSVTLAEFEERFDSLWRDKYSTYDPETDGWGKRYEDRAARCDLHERLLAYARDSHFVAVSRREKDRARRIFDEMGIDPADLELVHGPAAPPTAATFGTGTPDSAGSRIMYVERKAGRLSRATRGSAG